MVTIHEHNPDYYALIVSYTVTFLLLLSESLLWFENFSLWFLIHSSVRSKASADC